MFTSCTLRVEQQWWDEREDEGRGQTVDLTVEHQGEGSVAPSSDAEFAVPLQTVEQTAHRRDDPTWQQQLQDVSLMHCLGASFPEVADILR